MGAEPSRHANLRALTSALVTGIAGQDGSYLAEMLLARGYQVYGIVRRPLSEQFPNLAHIRDQVTLMQGDARDPDLIHAALQELRPDEIYHLASPTFVPALWERPSDAVEAIASATARLLEAVLAHCPQSRVLIASSREIFGATTETPQRETTPFHPTNPYAIAKLASHLLCGALREHAGLHVCSAILYNHESPRRPERFVTRKVTRAAAAIKLGLEQELVLGDLEAVRDWCFAGDAMLGAWMILQDDVPDDFVIASGHGRTVRELVDCAFDHVDLDADDFLQVDTGLVRSYDAFAPVGDPTKAEQRLGWRAQMSFEELIGAMVDNDLRLLQAESRTR